MPKGYPKAKGATAPQPVAVQPHERVAPPSQEDDASFVPAHMSLDEMKADDLAQFAMRSYGRRPDESLPLPKQVEQVKRWGRGNPLYMR